MLTTYIISVSDLHPQIIIIHLPSLKGVILLCDKTCFFFFGGCRGGGGRCTLCIASTLVNLWKCPVSCDGKAQWTLFLSCKQRQSLANTVQTGVMQMLDITVHQTDLCSADIKYQENQLHYPVGSVIHLLINWGQMCQICWQQRLPACRLL